MTEHHAATSTTTSASAHPCYQLLDLVPSARGNEVRVKRHDEYDEAA